MSSLVRSLAGDLDLFTVLTPFTYDSSARKTTEWIPPANIIEEESGYTIEMAVPGMSRGDFKVTTEGQRLTISGESSQTDRKDRTAYARQEFGFNREFSRSWTLPSNVNSRSITARYDAGILTVEVPTEKKRGRFEVKVE